MPQCDAFVLLGNTASVCVVNEGKLNFQVMIKMMNNPLPSKSANLHATS